MMGGLVTDKAHPGVRSGPKYPKVSDAAAIGAFSKKFQSRLQGRCEGAQLRSEGISITVELSSLNLNSSVRVE